MKPKEIILKSTKNMWRKWSIAFKIMPLIILVAILKFISHKFGFEIMELNALFTTLVAGTIFLITYMFLLKNDLDNPFDYTVNGERGPEISLKPIRDLRTEINAFR